MWFGQARTGVHRKIDKPAVKCTYSRHRYLGGGYLMAEMLLNEELFRSKAEAEVWSSQSIARRPRCLYPYQSLITP